MVKVADQVCYQHYFVFDKISILGERERFKHGVTPLRRHVTAIARLRELVERD